jgi:hypothetical protein
MKFEAMKFSSDLPIHALSIVLERELIPNLGWSTDVIN